MGTLAISSANLNTLENNMLTLNDNITSVTNDIININGQISAVNENVGTIENKVNSLEEDIRAFMQEIRGTTIVANAQNDILLKENEFNKTFGKYKSIRSSVTGLLDSINLNLVRKSTLKVESEKIIYNAPNYYLSYALLAISCWFTNDKIGANNALNNALKLDDKKTSLLMGLIHSKLGRVGTSYKWINRYLKSQKSNEIDNDFIILLDAYSEGVFDSSINDLIKTELDRIIRESNDKDVDEMVTNRFTGFFTNGKTHKTCDFYYLTHYSDNSSGLIDNYVNSKNYYDAYYNFKDLVTTSKYEREKNIDDFINSLIESFDRDEINLKRNILKDDLIIKYNGDSKKANEEFNNSKLAFEYTNNIITLFSNILLDHNETALSTKKLAASYLKNHIKDGLDKALPTSEVVATSININEFSSSTIDGANEKELLEQMLKEIKIPYENRANRISFINTKTLISFLLGFFGIVAFFTFNMVVGIIMSIMGICLLAFFIIQTFDERDKILNEFNEVKDKYIEVLENTLAEVVDINFSVKRAKDNYDYIVNYLKSFEVR